MTDIPAGNVSVDKAQASPATKVRGYWGSVWNRLRYDYVTLFCLGLILVIVLLAVFAPWLGVAAVPPALVGLALHEHAYVQSGQAVPLA